MMSDNGKAVGAFLTIREVSETVGVPPHILRFWETRFPQLKPLQRGGNRRYYRPADVALAHALHRLLHQDGYTVKGVQKLIASEGLASVIGDKADPGEAAADASASTPAVAAPVAAVQSGIDRARLVALRDRLLRALAA